MDRAGPEARPRHAIGQGAAAGTRPGRDRVRRGARVILQGPRRRSSSFRRPRHAPLRHAHRPRARQARGFTVLSPSGKLSTSEPSSACRSLTAAPPRPSGSSPGWSRLSRLPAGGPPGVTIHHDQTAQIDGRTVAARPRVSKKDAVPTSARSSRPVRMARTLNLDFTRPDAGTLLDAEGRGIGLTHRLPGTGSALPSAIRIFV